MPLLDKKHLTAPTSSTENLTPLHESPTMALAAEKEAGSHSNHEFDPCENAKPYSPFYNHDTPRGSMDYIKSKSSLHVAVRDLEAQNGVTPCQSNDHRPNAADGGTLKPWTTRTSFSGKDKSRCLTKPKPRGCSWMSNLPKRQKLLIKLLIALFVVGAMVGIGVGISLKVGGGVYKDQNSTAKIGTV